MRVHGSVVIKRRKINSPLKHYADARTFLEEDFSFLCGYCGKSSKIMRRKFHIDHFVPKSLFPKGENDYNNLVLACPKCNLSKSDKWPTNDPALPNNGIIGFVDPASREYDEHLKRDADGFIVGITELGNNICKMLHFDIRRTDIYWKISQILEMQNQLEKLYNRGLLPEEAKDFYIELNMMLKTAENNIFESGE